jgi:hypothetical protein
MSLRDSRGIAAASQNGRISEIGVNKIPRVTGSEGYRLKPLGARQNGSLDSPDEEER